MVKATIRGVGLVLAMLVVWGVSSTAMIGGWWIPAQGMGDGSGYWLMTAPDNLDPHHGHDHIQSEVYAARGSVGRLKDINGNDHYLSICDNYANFRDAFTSASNLNGTARNITDRDGVGAGCGVDANIGFNAGAHYAAENNDDGGASGISYHPG